MVIFAGIAGSGPATVSGTLRSERGQRAQIGTDRGVGGRAHDDAGDRHRIALHRAELEGSMPTAHDARETRRSCWCGTASPALPAPKPGTAARRCVAMTLAVVRRVLRADVTRDRARRETARTAIR